MNNTDNKNRFVTIIVLILLLLLLGVLGLLIYMILGINDKDNRKIYWLAVGDSITVGNEDGSYVEYIVRKNKNVILTKRSWGGIGISELSDLTTHDFLRGAENADIVTVLIGTNDFGYDKPLEEFESSLNTYIATLKTDFPTAKIVFMTPLYRDYFADDIPTAKGTVNNLGITLYDYRDSMIRTCKSNDVEVIDLTGDDYLNKDNIRQLTKDGLHPTPQGHQMIAKKIKPKLGL